MRIPIGIIVSLLVMIAATGSAMGDGVSCDPTQMQCGDVVIFSVSAGAPDGDGLVEITVNGGTYASDSGEGQPYKIRLRAVEPSGEVHTMQRSITAWTNSPGNSCSGGGFLPHMCTCGGSCTLDSVCQSFISPSGQYCGCRCLKLFLPPDQPSPIWLNFPKIQVPSGTTITVTANPSNVLAEDNSDNNVATTNVP